LAGNLRKSLCPLGDLPIVLRARENCAIAMRARRIEGIGRRHRAVVLLVLLLPAAAVFGACGGGQSVRLGGLDVVVWPARTAGDLARPVVIFSHGFHGCATQSRFLMDALASGGYIVFAPNHRDATCHGGRARLTDPPMLPFRDPRRWNASTYSDRAEDIRLLIEAIRGDVRFRGRVDWSRLALAGHSLGGYTVLGLAGAWPSWRLPGVRAVLALSPYTQPFLSRRALGGLSAPVMYQGGTLDFAITPALGKPDGAFDQSPEPKYFIEFARAGHLAWIDAGRAKKREIVAYSLAFLDHYVRGEPADPLLTRADPGVAIDRYATELGQKGAGTERHEDPAAGASRLPRP
jgi:pimeloyl-ACP methyl ester carboxylesterase